MVSKIILQSRGIYGLGKISHAHCARPKRSGGRHTGAPDLIKPEMVRPGQVILALSNPNPEIDPGAALAAGTAFAADSKSVNNVLGFPGILRGAVDTFVPRITHEMYLAAAQTIADMTPSGELVPSPLDKKVHQAVARAAAEKAVEQGLARAEYVPYLD